MPRDNFSDLLAFVAVARERSFTRAAAQLGVSPSALSHTIRGLEARVGVRLLSRTTRSVAPTEAGQRLLEGVAPRFEEIEAEVASVAELRDEAAGTIRITSTEHVAESILRPVLARFLLANPQVRVEISVEYALTDIVAAGFDMGVRLGDEVAKDMIAVRIGPDMRFLVVGAPAYLAGRDKPRTPQDLTRHNCINLRLPTHGGLLPWELKKGKSELKVRVEGQCVYNGTYLILGAALDGLGLALLPEDLVRAPLADGRLQQVLADWSPTFPGCHLYYPSRRHPSRAMTMLVDALRFRG